MIVYDRYTMIYERRTRCVFCEGEDLEQLLDQSYTVPLGNFAVASPNAPSHFMPYNVLHCTTCSTIQTEFVGDLNLIYENNFAGFFGSIRSRHNVLFSEFILHNSQVTSIAEVGAGNGQLSDTLLETKDIPYTIVDPSYGGSTHKKRILQSYFETCTQGDIQENTVVMSHVFEHFYTPKAVLQTLQSLATVDYVYISLPDLEAFIEDGTYHVLNSEHTFFVTNQFLKEVFAYYGFTCTRQYFHERHSVFFEFQREPPSKTLSFPNNQLAKEKTLQFFSRLLSQIQLARALQETGLPVYIWPCSMHTLFALSFGLDTMRINAVLDNSPLKIGKYLYGFQYPCISFETTVHSDEDKVILLTGGCYTKEVYHTALSNKKNRVLQL